jgi:hypothetical protein
MTWFGKERFRQICRGERPGDFAILGNGFNNFWPETLSGWVHEGAPESFTDPQFEYRSRNAVDDFFDFDESRLLYEVRSGIDSGASSSEYVPGITVADYGPLICPAFEPVLLDEDEKSIVVRNSAGIRERVLKDKAFNMPTWLEFPVKDRASWKKFKERLNPTTPERYPSDWDRYVTQINALECPVSMEVGGFFGYVNMWVGIENLMLMFYDDPALIEEMMESILYMEKEIVRKVITDIKVDYVWYWEDMAYKGGSMISPDMVRKFMLPKYKDLNDTVRSSGCEVFYLDSDGNIDDLIPIWLEAGINFFWPLECAAGMDPLLLRRKYGKDIVLAGGLDKREMMRDKGSLKHEVMSKVPELVETGPYFPSVDHIVPVDMSFENYCYFINLLRRIRGDDPMEFISREGGKHGGV